MPSMKVDKVDVEMDLYVLLIEPQEEVGNPSKRILPAREYHVVGLRHWASRLEGGVLRGADSWFRVEVPGDDGAWLRTIWCDPLAETDA